MSPAVTSPRRHSSFIVHPSSFRSGVSLLEVLVSIFVIMFGLLGVAAILPLGSRNVAEIVKSDNASACGTSALSDVRTWGMPIRSSSTPTYSWGMLSPFSWRWASFASSPTPVQQVAWLVPPSTGTEYYIPYGDSFAIDPLFMARAARTFTPATGPSANKENPRPQYFPYDPTTPSRDYWQLHMSRATLNLPGDPTSGAMTTNDWARHEAFFDRFFRWQDDVNVQLLTGVTESERPRQMFLCSDGAGRVLPALPTDTSGAVPYVAQTQGDYTWMAIVTPSFNENGTATWSGGGVTSDTSVPANRRTQYLVQVVVFYNRDFSLPANYLTTETPPLERTVTANILSGGYGGGDVKLTVPTTTSGTDFTGYLNVRKGNWIMLCGQTPRGNVFRWYRVVSPGEPPTEETRDSAIPDSVTGAKSNWVRFVTLAGPDWNPAWCHATGGVLDDVDGDTTLMDAAAVITDDVIGVYTMTFEVDRDSQAIIIGQ